MASQKKGAKSLLLWSRSIFLEFTNSLGILKPLGLRFHIRTFNQQTRVLRAEKKASHTRWIPPDLEIFREMWLVGLEISNYHYDMRF